MGNPFMELGQEPKKDVLGQTAPGSNPFMTDTTENPFMQMAPAPTSTSLPSLIDEVAASVPTGAQRFAAEHPILSIIGQVGKQLAVEVRDAVELAIMSGGQFNGAARYLQRLSDEEGPEVAQQKLDNALRGGAMIITAPLSTPLINLFKPVVGGAASWMASEAVGGAIYGAVRPTEDDETRMEAITGDAALFGLFGGAMYGGGKGVSGLWRYARGVYRRVRTAKASVRIEARRQLAIASLKLRTQGTSMQALPPQQRAAVITDAYARALDEADPASIDVDRIITEELELERRAAQVAGEPTPRFHEAQQELDVTAAPGERALDLPDPEKPYEFTQAFEVPPDVEPALKPAGFQAGAPMPEPELVIKTMPPLMDITLPMGIRNVLDVRSARQGRERMAFITSLDDAIAEWGTAHTYNSPTMEQWNALKAGLKKHGYDFDSKIIPLLDETNPPPWPALFQRVHVDSPVPEPLRRALLDMGITDVVTTDLWSGTRDVWHILDNIAPSVTTGAVDPMSGTLKVLDDGSVLINGFRGVAGGPDVMKPRIQGFPYVAQFPPTGAFFTRQPAKSLTVTRMGLFNRPGPHPDFPGLPGAKKGVFAMFNLPETAVIPKEELPLTGAIRSGEVAQVEYVMRRPKVVDSWDEVLGDEAHRRELRELLGFTTTKAPPDTGLMHTIAASDKQAERIDNLIVRFLSQPRTLLKLAKEGYDGLIVLNGFGGDAEFVLFRPENARVLKKLTLADVTLPRDELTAMGKQLAKDGWSREQISAMLSARMDALGAGIGHQVDNSAQIYNMVIRRASDKVAEGLAPAEALAQAKDDIITRIAKDVFMFQFTEAAPKSAASATAIDRMRVIQRASSALMRVLRKKVNGIEPLFGDTPEEILSRWTVRPKRRLPPILQVEQGVTGGTTPIVRPGFARDVLARMTHMKAKWTAEREAMSTALAEFEPRMVTPGVPPPKGFIPTAVGAEARGLETSVAERVAPYREAVSPGSARQITIMEEGIEAAVARIDPIEVSTPQVKSTSLLVEESANGFQALYGLGDESLEIGSAMETALAREGPASEVGLVLDLTSPQPFEVDLGRRVSKAERQAVRKGLTEALQREVAPIEIDPVTGVRSSLLEDITPTGLPEGTDALAALGIMGQKGLDGLGSALSNIASGSKGAVPAHMLSGLTGATLFGFSYNEDLPQEPKHLLRAIGGMLMAGAFYGPMKRWMTTSGFMKKLILNANPKLLIKDAGATEALRQAQDTITSAQALAESHKRFLRGIFPDEAAWRNAMYTLDEFLPGQGFVPAEFNLMTPEQQKATVALAQFYRNLGVVLEHEGVLDGFREAYVSHILPPETFQRWRVHGFRTLPTGGSFTKRRRIETIRELEVWAKNQGLPGPNMNLPDVHALHLRSAYKALGTVRMVKMLKELNLILPAPKTPTAPAGWRQIRIAGYGQSIAPEEIAVALENYAISPNSSDVLKSFDTIKSWWMRGIMFWFWEHGVNALRGTLLSSINPSLYASSMKAIKRMDPGVLEAARHGLNMFNRPDYAPEVSVAFERVINKITSVPGLGSIIKAGGHLIEKQDRILWDNIIPAAQYLVYQREMQRWMSQTGGKFIRGSAQYTAAARRAADIANTAMGKLPLAFTDKRLTQLGSPSWWTSPLSRVTSCSASITTATAA